jgi:hypothetical protein
MNNQRFEFTISFSRDEVKKENLISIRVVDNRSGNEVFNFEFPNLPDRMKTFEFYESEEWIKMRPEVEKRCYHFLFGNRS